MASFVEHILCIALFLMLIVVGKGIIGEAYRSSHEPHYLKSGMFLDDDGNNGSVDDCLVCDPQDRPL